MARVWAVIILMSVIDVIYVGYVYDQNAKWFTTLSKQLVVVLAARGKSANQRHPTIRTEGRK